MEKNKNISQRKRLAALFASFAIIFVGTFSLLETMSLDYYSVLGTFKKVLPASIILGCLGWVMGMILDRPKRHQRASYNNMFLNEITKNNSLNTISNEPEASAEVPETEENKE